jgi:hypothetical protein
MIHVTSLLLSAVLGAGAVHLLRGSWLRGLVVGAIYALVNPYIGWLTGWLIGLPMTIPFWPSLVLILTHGLLFALLTWKLTKLTLVRSLAAGLVVVMAWIYVMPYLLGWLPTITIPLPL